MAPTLAIARRQIDRRAIPLAGFPREKHERPLAEYAATIEKHAGAVCDDMQAVAASPIFPKTIGTRDAGPYLNLKVAWDVNAEDAIEKEHPERFRRSENAIPPVAPHCAATVTAARNAVPMTLDDQLAMNGNSSPGEMWSMDYYPFVRGYMGKILLAISISSSAEKIETLYGDGGAAKPAAVP